jgi:predicted small lipoprotein YifL
MKTLALLLVMMAPLAACEKTGPLERLGEDVDEAVEDIRNGGETTGNKIDDAIDDVRDDIEDATK